MIANNRNTGDLIIMINILILLIAFGCQITFAYTGCLCDACNDERKEAWDLINSTMFDSHNRISTYLHTTNEVILLLKVLDYEGFQAKLASYGYFNEEQKYHGAFKVQRTSLDILTALFTQSNISQKMTSNLVIPLLKNFVRFCSEEDTLQFQIKLVLDRGRTALWCAKQYILSDEDRNAALIAVVDGSIRIPNMHPCGFPLDMLSNTNLNYKSVIEKLLRVKKKKETQGFRDDARRIQYCITKIGIRENLLQMDNTRKNTYLNELFNEHAFKEQSWQTTGFGLWLIARIKLIGDMNAILSLKHIWSNESLDSSYRSAAQEVLIFLKAIKPEERTIFFD